MVGDHHLIGVIGADRASNHWPLDGKRAEVELDEFRYASDLAVLMQLIIPSLFQPISVLCISMNQIQPLIFMVPLEELITSKAHR